MFFPWPRRASKRTKKALREHSPRARQAHRLQIDPLEDRRLLAVYIEAEASFLDPARPQDVTVQEGNSGLTNAVFRIALDAAEVNPVTVIAQTQDGTGGAAAVAGSDYFAGAVQVTFNPGETEHFVTVGVFGDVVAELDESFFVRLSNFTGTGGIIKAPGALPSDVAGRGVVTITNDDATFIQINDVQVTEGNAGTVDAVFTVNLSGPNPNTVTVNFATNGGTATANVDYQSVSGTLTFNPGETVKFVTVPVNGDLQDEVNETFFVNLSAASNAQIQDAQGQGTIVDDEGLVVAINDVSTLEGDSGLLKNMVFTVTLSEVRPSTINVQYRTDNVPAPPPPVIPARVGNAPFQRPPMVAQPVLAYQQNDYIPVSGILTFAPGVTSQNITVQVKGENIHELDETFRVLLTSVTTNGGETINLLSTFGTGTIVNDDQVPQLVIHDASTQSGIHPGTGQPIVDEGDNPLTPTATLFPEFTFSLLGNPDQPWTRPVRINVTLSNPSSGSIAFAYSTIGETATPGVDYRRSYPNHNNGLLGGLTVYFLGSQTDALFGDPLNVNPQPQEIDPPFDITEYGPGMKPLTQPGGPSPTTGLPNEYAQVIFYPGEVSHDIVLRIFKEASAQHGNPPVAEQDETFLIRADGFSGDPKFGPLPPGLIPSAPAIIADDTGRVTIIDDDPDPSVGLSPASATIVEGDSGQKFLLFTVTVSSPHHELPITVDYVTVQLAPGPNTAEAGVDYITTQGTLTFNPRISQLPPLPVIPGVTSQAFSVPILGDFLDEQDEMFQVVLSNPINATLGTSVGIGTIVDNEGPTATLGGDVTVVEGDSGTVDLVFTVGLSAASAQNIEIGFFTSNGSALGGQDFISSTGTITFAAGTSAPQPITIRAIGDTIFEGLEFFLLNLTNPNPNLVTLGDNQAIGFIQDDDFLPSARIDDASVVEGNSGTSNMVFRVRLVNPDGSPLTTPLNQTVSIDFSTLSNSAQANVDFTTTTGNLVFNHTLAETEKLITVPIISDLIAEPDEELLMQLTNPVNVAFFNSVAQGTIIDDDSVPGISIAALNAFELEGNNLVFQVTLSRSSTSPITVRFDTSDGSAVASSDYTATSGTLTFAPGETTKLITVTLLTDGVPEASETFTVGLSVPTNAVVSSAPATGTIVDIDTKSIIVDNATVVEGGDIVFRVRLSQPDPTVTVEVTTSNGSATQPGDYTPTMATINFASGQTVMVTVPTVGDTLDEINETFFLNLSNPVNANLANSQGTATIIDDDGPTLSIDDAITFEGNTGLVFLDFTVSLSSGSPQPVTVVFNTQDGTALDELPTPPSPNNDYVFTTGTLTFMPGEVTKKIRVNIQADTIDELDENFFVQISNAASNGFPLAITDATATGIIVDDDGPQISSQAITVQEGSSGVNLVNFVVTLSAVSPQDVTVDYFTSSGTATANIDFFPVNGTITFPSGATVAAIAVQIATDTTPEQDETFFLNLVNPTGGATVLTNPVQATILDDDTLLFINDITVLEGDAGTQNVVLTVTMNQTQTTDVTVEFATAAGTAVAGQDYNASTGTLTLTPFTTTGQITIQVRGDLLDEPDETFDVVLSNPIGAFLGDPIGTVTIQDNNDPPPVISVTGVTVTEGNSGTVDAVFNVTLSSASGNTVTAVFSTLDVTAIGGADYTAVNGTLTFQPGETSKQITVPVTGDTFVESNETFQLELVNIQFATPTTLSATGTIIDDDATLSINNITVAEGSTTVDAVFAVTLSKPTSAPVTLDFITANGTAISGLDYTATSGSLSFAPGQTSLTVTVQVLGDALDEVDETFTVNLTNIVGAAAVGSSMGTGTIVDDDPAPTLSITDVTVTEGDVGQVNAVFTVSLSQPSGKTVTVVYTTNPGTASAGVDYQTVSNTLTFFAGETSKPIQVPVNGDLELEQNETFFVDLSLATNASLADNQGVGTILDDEPRMQIGDMSVLEGDSGTTFLVFNVTLTKAAPSNVTVVYNTVPGSGTATDGADYQTVNATLTFFPGDNARQISVPVFGDVLSETDETFTLILTNPNGAILLNNTATGTIINDDPLPLIAITDFAQTEGDTGLSNFVFTVTLDAVSGQTVTVQYNTANGTAAAGTDYQARSGVLTFLAGETSKTISVPVIGDPNAEPDETFFVNLTNPVNAAFGDNSGQGTIINDEPVMVIGDATVSEQDAGPVNIVFPVTLSRASAISITTIVSTADQTALAPADYTALAGLTLTFAPGETSKTVTVQVQGDLVDEDTETFLVNLSGTSIGASVGDGQAVGTILDNDPPPTLTIGPISTTEGNAGVTAAVFTVMLSVASGRPVTVQYATADNTATILGLDYFPTSGILSFAPGTTLQSLTVQVRGDLVGEGDETFFVNLTNPVNATVPVPQGVGTIVDDEPRVFINDVVQDESISAMIFLLTLDAAASGPVTLNYSTSDGTALAGQDYTAVSGVVTFNPGQVVQSITVPIIADNIDEDDEQFFVNLSGVSNNASIQDPTGTGLITDDDAPPTLSIAGTTVTEGNSGQTIAQFMVSLSVASGRTVMVSYNTVGQTATSGIDFDSVLPTTVTFLPGETTKIVTVAVNGDTLAESNETFEVQLANAVNANLPITPMATGLIVDDEPRITIEDVSIAEGDAGTTNAVFNVRLSTAPAVAVTVNYSTQNGTAIAPGDFTPASGVVIFNPGETLQTITVPVVGDVVLEPNEVFLVNLSNASSNALITDGQAQGVIANDDPLPSISVANTSFVEGDSSTSNFVFTVLLTPASGQPATVNFNTSNSSPVSAIAGQDYLPTSGVLTFSPGETAKTVTVRVIGDLNSEQDETFQLNLQNAAGASIATSSATGTIVDNDTSINIASNGIIEGNVGQRNLVFNVTLGRPVNKPVLANFSTANGTVDPAVAGQDYIATSGAISFAPGETLKTITVLVNGDTTSEPDETFFVTLTSISGAAAGTVQAVGSILNDDGLPTLSINDINVIEGNTGTSNAVFTLTLSEPPGQPIVVPFSTADGTATAGADYLPASGAVTFAPGQTVQQLTVSIVGDTAIESQETFTVNLGIPGNATVIKGTGTATIIDNEQTNLILTGAGAGGGPHVRGFQAVTLAQEHSYFAYAPAFAGGVRVASADVNGDGEADMITAPGAGGGPHVRVFDGVTGQIITEFFAFEASFTGGLNVAAGDTNQDGRAEIFIGADGPSSGGRVRIFDGMTGALLQELSGPAGAFTGGVRVAAGDINGDGRSDLIMGAGPGNSPRVFVRDVASGAVLADFFAYAPGFTGGIYVAAGDVNGDGRADIATGADRGGGPHVRVFSGANGQQIHSFFAYHPNFGGGVRLGMTDFNGDGVADIITGAGPGGGPHVRILSGNNLAELAGFFAYHPNFGGGVYVAGSLRGPGSPLRSPGNAPTPSSENLSADQLQPLVTQAIAAWAAQRADAEMLRRLDVRVADLPAGYAAMAFAEAIYLDVNADGHGWFVDPTPTQDEEFELIDGLLRAREDGPAAGRLDLLTAIAHEMGHVLGLEDLHVDEHAEDLMAEALALGVRRAPTGAADAVFDSGSW